MPWVNKEVDAYSPFALPTSFFPPEIFFLPLCKKVLPESSPHPPPPPHRVIGITFTFPPLGHRSGFLCLARPPRKAAPHGPFRELPPFFINVSNTKVAWAPFYPFNEPLSPPPTNFFPIVTRLPFLISDLFQTCLIFRRTPTVLYLGAFPPFSRKDVSSRSTLKNLGARYIPKRIPFEDYFPFSRKVRFSRLPRELTRIDIDEEKLREPEVSPPPPPKPSPPHPSPADHERSLHSSFRCP